MTADPTAARHRAGRVPILVYHSVTTEATDQYRGFALDPGLFREQMAAVVDAGRSGGVASAFLLTISADLHAVVAEGAVGVAQAVDGDALPILAGRTGRTTPAHAAAAV